MLTRRALFASLLGAPLVAKVAAPAIASPLPGLVRYSWESAPGVSYRHRFAPGGAVETSLIVRELDHDAAYLGIRPWTRISRRKDA